MNDFLRNIWQELRQEEERLLSWQRRKRIRERTIGVFVLVTNLLVSYIALFGFAARYSDNHSFQNLLPVPALWNWVKQSEDNALMVSILGTIGIGLIGTFIALTLRLFTRKIKPKGQSREPQTQSLESALEWARALDAGWQKKIGSFLLVLLVTVLCNGAMALTSILLCKNAGANQEALSNSIFLGVGTVVILAVMTCVLRMYNKTPWPDGKNSDGLIYDIEKQIQKETTERERRNKIEAGIKAFLDGHLEKAAEILADLDVDDCGDVEAIKILCDDKADKTIEVIRRCYDGLWKAKDLGFYNAKVRQFVDLTLEVITPELIADTEPLMVEIYQNYLDGYHGSVVYKCGKLMEFGYPNAIAACVASEIKLNHVSSSYQYEKWLRALKIAKRRGATLFGEDSINDLIEKLEISLRQSQFVEEEKKRREKNSPFTAAFYQTGPISIWAEDSGWTDFRTGETLYRVNGHIVNAKGEEVSPAWWE